MDPDPLTESYLEACRQLGTPPNTVKARRRALCSLGNAGVATREDVEAWWLTRQTLSVATRSTDLACLRSFYKWALRWEHRTDNPTLRLDAPKVPNGLPRPISRANLGRLLETLTPDLRRAVCLGAYAGLRVSEAAALTWPDVDVETRRVSVVDSKGGKSRLVGCSPLLLDSLLPDTGWNVVTGTEHTYTAATLQRKVNRAIKAAGVDATFHQLRHRFGTVAYAATGDLLAVGRAMGHSSPVTTSVYAASSDEMLDRIASAVAR